MTVTQDTQEKITLPAPGYEVFVKHANHAYHPANDKGKPGRRVPGASTIGHAFPDSPDGLMYWVEKMCMEGVARLGLALEDGKKLPTDPYVLRSMLEQHALRWPQLRDAAAQRGTNVHVLMLEALAGGDDVPDLDELPEDQQGYGQAVFRWWQERKPKPTHVEQVVLSLEHRYAGRFDLRCEIEAPMQPCDGVGIVDLKTAKNVYRSDHIQLRAYDVAAQECGIGEQDWLMVLQVMPDGSYVEHWCAAETGDFMLALDSYNAAKRVDRAMKGAK